MTPLIPHVIESANSLVLGVRPKAYAHHVEQQEVVLRMIGFLTQAVDLSSDPQRAEAAIEDGGQDVDVLGALLKDVVSASVAVPPDTPPAEVAAAIFKTLEEPMANVIGVLGWAFCQLAEVHDAGRTDISTADLLQGLALRAAGGGQ